MKQQTDSQRIKENNRERVKRLRALLKQGKRPSLRKSITPEIISLYQSFALNAFDYASKMTIFLPDEKYPPGLSAEERVVRRKYYMQQYYHAQKGHTQHEVDGMLSIQDKMNIRDFTNAQKVFNQNGESK